MSIDYIRVQYYTYGTDGRPSERKKTFSPAEYEELLGKAFDNNHCMQCAKEYIAAWVGDDTKVRKILIF